MLLALVVFSLASITSCCRFFRMFKNLLKEIRIYAQKFIDRGKDFNLELAIKTRIISDGLKYSLATGNWGDVKKAHQARAGVSQVRSPASRCSSVHHSVMWQSLHLNRWTVSEPRSVDRWTSDRHLQLNPHPVLCFLLRRCWTVWPSRPLCLTSAESTLRSAETANWQNPDSCTTRCGGWCVRPRRPRWKHNSQKSSVPWEGTHVTSWIQQFVAGESRLNSTWASDLDCGDEQSYSLNFGTQVWFLEMSVIELQLMIIGM